MRDEIAVLKGEKAKPKFKSSKMDENTDRDDGDGEEAEQPKRAEASKRSKTAQTHADCVIAPTTPVPPGARFKGYRDVVIQGLVHHPSSEPRYARS